MNINKFIITLGFLALIFTFSVSKVSASTLLSDTFTGTTIDSAKWNIVDTAGTNIVQNNKLGITNSFSAGTWGQTALYSKDTFSRTDLSLIAKLTPGSAQLLGYGDYNFNSAGTKAYIIDLSDGSNGSPIYALSWVNGSLSAFNLTCGTLTSGATYKLTVTGSGFDVYKNTGSGNVLQCSMTTDTTITNKPVFFESEGAVSYFENLLVSENAPIEVPSAITDLSSNESDGQVDLSWGIPGANGAGLTDYIVQYRVYGTNTWTTFDDGVGTSTASTTIPGLTNGTRYEFNVYATNSVGNGVNSNHPNTIPMGVIFSDNFETLSLGNISGQNGWLAASGSSTWSVGNGNGGKVVNQTFTYGSDVYNLNQITNGQSTWTNQRVSVDFQSFVGQHDRQVWIRKTSPSGDGGGYALHINNNSIYILKHDAASGVANTALTTGSYSFTDGVWYRAEIEAINNISGNPVLKVYIYPIGQSRPAPLFTYTDSSSPFVSGYVSLGTDVSPGTFDNFVVYGTSQDALTITSPSRGVSGAPSQATISILDESGIPFYIPYIQTSTSLSATATVGSTILPSGGGVKFVLNEGSSSQQILYDTSAPFNVTFTGLAKGTYSIDTYVVDSSHIVQNGVGTYDQVIGMGIGDIVTAIGDSITEGYFGNDYGSTPVTDWTNAPSGSVSLDNRNFPQFGPTSNSYKKSWMTELNNELSSYYGYPIFIMNEGWGGYKATDYISLMSSSQWTNRQTSLHPNKWLIHLGVNDGIANVTPTTLQANIQTIINTLETNYNATSTNIWLAKPNYSSTYTNSQNYLPNIVALRAANNLGGGPDFWTFYGNHDYYSGDPVHPNVAGITQMARLWALSIMSPKNLSVSQTGPNVSVSWNKLSSVDSTIVGYKVYYGTSTSALTTVIDVGNASSTTISSGLSNGQTYYFAVQGYDNDSVTPNTTATSSKTSFAYSSDSIAPSISITSPTTGSTVSGSSVSFAATSSDNVAIAGVQFKVDTTNIGSEDTTLSYGTTWDSTGVSDGSHTLSAVARDTSNNYATSTISVNVDNTAPVRSANSPSGTLTQGTTATTISLTTNEAAICKYSTSPGTSYISMTLFNTTSSTSHSTSVTGLSNGNTYTYYVKCSDGQSNINATDYSISFSIGNDTTAPIISSITTSSLSISGATINWTTNENADTQLRYGTSTVYTATTTLNTTQATSHTVNLSNLLENTLYHYQVISKDLSNNIATSADQTFTTSLTSVTPTTTSSESSGSTRSSRRHIVINGIPQLSPATVTTTSTITTPSTPTLGCLPGYLFSATTGQKCSTVVSTTTSLPIVSSASTYTFTRNLTVGMTGDDVKQLQMYLNTHGFTVASSGPGSLGNETTLFGNATKAALIKFQQAHAITPAVGYFGVVTRTNVTK